MTHGALIFAQNNSAVNYVKMAEFAACRVKEYLDIPVSIVTDTPDIVTPGIFDKVILKEQTTSNWQKTIYDGSTPHLKVDWKNQTRSSAYDLTPYTKTLVIDSDYIISSSVLKPAFDREFDLQIYKNSFPLVAWRPAIEFQKISPFSLDFYWATTFIFTKNKTTGAFFNIVDYIKVNWDYYRLLYNIYSPVFRNDYAFSIAIHIMNNHTTGDFAIELPGTMTYVTDKDYLTAINGDKMQFLLQKEKTMSEYIAAKTEGIDVHVMNKLSLLRCINE